MMIAELKNGQDLVLDGNFELLIEPNLELALSMTFSYVEQLELGFLLLAAKHPN